MRQKDKCTCQPIGYGILEYTRLKATSGGETGKGYDVLCINTIDGTGTPWAHLYSHVRGVSSPIYR